MGDDDDGYPGGSFAPSVGEGFDVDGAGEEGVLLGVLGVRLLWDGSIAVAP